jgi:hypothetical protein
MFAETGKSEVKIHCKEKSTYKGVYNRSLPVPGRTVYDYLLITLKKGIKNLWSTATTASIHHCKNAEMTPELCDDLANISFDKLQDVINTINTVGPIRNPNNLHIFIPSFLFRLKRVVCYISPLAALKY